MEPRVLRSGAAAVFVAFSLSVTLAILWLAFFQ